MKLFRWIWILISLARVVTSSSSALFNITKHWDGRDIDYYDQEMAQVELSVDPEGNLVIEVSAMYFHSRAYQRVELNSATCPERSFRLVEQYEVVQVMLLNHLEEYIQVVINPGGAYNINLLSNQRKVALSSLPLFPEGAHVVNNCVIDPTRPPCASFDACWQKWSASVTIPIDYIPVNVTKFNAYSIHGTSWGDQNPDEDEMTYEFYSPIDASANLSHPDIHHLDSFEDIKGHLDDIGFEQMTEPSMLWKTIRSNGDYEMRYDIALKSDCTEAPTDDGYSASITTIKKTNDKQVHIMIQISDQSEVIADIDEDLKEGGNTLPPMLNSSDASESFWLTFSNSKNEMVKIGLNQFESYRVELYDENGTFLTDNLTLPWVSCMEQEINNTIWTCNFDIDWTYLPPNVHFFQMVHAHFNLTNSLLEPADSREFFGTICSGFDSASELMEIDWRGCEMDSRTITNLDSNSQYSEVWLQFVDVPEVTTTTPKSTTQVLTTNASSFKLFPSVFMSFLVLIMSLVAMS